MEGYVRDTAFKVQSKLGLEVKGSAECVAACGHLHWRFVGVACLWKSFSMPSREADVGATTYGAPLEFVAVGPAVFALSAWVSALR